MAFLMTAQSASAIYIRPVKLNWPLMNQPEPDCLLIDPFTDQILYSIQARISDELDPAIHPDMYLRYQAVTSLGSYSGSVGPLRWSDFHYEGIVEGHNVYKFQHLITTDFGAECGEESEFIVDLYGSLVTIDAFGNPTPYPIASHTDLFPAATYIQTTTFYEQKDACCQDPPTAPIIDENFNNNNSNLYTQSEPLIIGSHREDLKISPNPFSDEVVIELPQAAMEAQEDLYIRVFDLNGQLVRQFESTCCDASKVSLQVGDLPSGTYFWQIQAGTYIDNQKIIKL